MKIKKTKKKFTRLIIDIITSGKYAEGISFETSDYLIKYVLMNFITIFGGILLSLFLIINLENQMYRDAAVCAVMTFISGLCFLIARLKVVPLVPSWIMLIFYGLLCILLVMVGESHGSDFFIFVYPLLTIMLLGMKSGIIAALVLPIIVSAQMIVPGWSMFDYPIDSTVRMIAAYILVFAVMIVIETTRKTKDSHIETQNKKMQALKEEAEKANNSKSNFLATMSHEIRTPLNAVIGIAKIEMQDESLPEKYMEAFEKIHNSGNTLLGIINDILDMSKIETGKMALNPVEYDVPSLIGDTIQLNIVRIGSKPIEFKLSVDENLPSRLLGDELRLKQILNNLLSNAIKYTDKGQVHLSVNFKTINEDIMLVLGVSDTGQGMKEEDKKKLFSEYLRLNTDANRSIEGTGLGLNITKKLVEMMNGEISV
ncbi:MAG: ATP-binding protein, partial [Treponema sp.]|nr:ATP-binding protein [Treponema sp.]